MLHYERQGSGPDIVLIHGFLASGKVFEPLTTQLATRFTVTTIDLPGFGGSAREPVPDSVGALAQLVAENIESMGIERCSVLGHSLGAWIALELSLDHAHLLDKAVLYGGSPDGICPDRFEPYEHSIERIRSQGIEDFGADLAAEWFREGKAAAGYPLTLKAAEGVSADVAIAHVKTWNDWQTSHRLAQVATPTLIVCGDGDRSTHPDLSIDMWRRIDGAQLFILPNAGHAAHLEYPQVFNAVIEAFVA